MAEKFLSDAEWKKFAKGRDLKDAPLIKAFEALEKARKPADQVSALAEIEKQTDALRKFVKADKDFGAYLDGIDKAIAKEEKIAKAAALEAEKAEKSESEDEEESPTLLTTKMVPLLRQVKAGDEAQVMIASTGKDVAVLLSRRSISPTRRKLMSDYLEVSGGVKFILGHCIFEEESYTFVVQSQASGLAKKIKAALLKQTQLRLKVRVRGEDPDDVDEDGEAGEHEGEEVPPQTQTQTQTQAPTQGNIPPAPPLPPDALKLRFEKRWAELEPRVLSALKANAGDVSKLRAVSEFVREKGEAGAWQAGIQGMESLEKLLPAAVHEEQGTPADEGAAFNARLAALLGLAKPLLAAGGEAAQEIKLKLSEGGMFGRKKDFEQAHALLDVAERLIKGGAGEQDEGAPSEDEQVSEDDGPKTYRSKALAPKVAFTTTRLAWDAARQQVRQQLGVLERAVLDAYRGTDDLAVVTKGIRMLDRVLASLDERLIDKMDEALNATTEEEQRDYQEEALDLIEEYSDFCERDPMMADLDDNGYVDLSVVATLKHSLKAMAAQLN